MLTVSVKSNIREQLDRLGSVRREIQEKAIVRSLNRTADQVKTAASRRLRDTYAIKKRDLDEAISVRKAWAGRLQAQIIAYGGSIPVFDFSASWSRRWAGARFTIKRGQRKTLRESFIATMDSGHRGVFVRVPGTLMRNKKKEQIREVFTASVPRLFSSRHIYAALRAAAGDLYDKNLRQQLKFLLGTKG